MADPKPPSTSDLFQLITGLKQVTTPDTTADSGADYYLNEPKTNEARTLRETKTNDSWLSSPQAAWDAVKFRDWLIATVFGNIAGNKSEFTALSEPVMFSKDVLAKTFTPAMEGVTDAIRQALIASDSKRERAYFSTLTFGVSKQKVGGKDVFVAGLGMRRQIKLWLTTEEGYQTDLEFFVPFFILPSHNHGDAVSSAWVRSINAGIAIKNTRGEAIGTDDGKELLAMRFNFRIPFKTEIPDTSIDQLELRTEFGTPEINIQKKIKDGLDWEKFTNWKTFLEKFCKEGAVGDLLNSPAGPLLSEKIDNHSGIKDLFLKQSKRDEIKTDIAKFKKELDETLALLDSITKWNPPEKKPAEPHSGSQKLGTVLASLGFMTSSPGGGGDFEYTFKIAQGVTIWSVLDALIDELDGFPLYVYGLASKTDKAKRVAVSLASQRDLNDSTKHYFGLAGLAYNILLNPVKEKDAKAKKEDDEDWVIVSDDNFVDDESVLIDLEEDEEEEDEGPPEEKAENKEPEKAEKGRVEVLLHIGKWFSNETLDDNWFLRLLPKSDKPGKDRVPLPGIRLLPLKRTTATDHTKANVNWTLLLEVLSFGVDVQGTTKDGLGLIQGIAGLFGLGALEVRLALKVSLDDIHTKKRFLDRVNIGVGVKLKDLRLSLGPNEDDKKKQKDKGGDDIVSGLQDVLSDEWVVLPETKPKKPTVKTRLSAKKKDKFSISVGYLTPLKEGSAGTLDIQLYDDKGNRGKMAIINIDRSAKFIYVKQIGIALKGVENFELSKGLPDSAQLTVALTGGIRLPVFELGFIGAKIIFQLNSPGKFKFALDGLDVSVKFGSVIISGSFMKVGIEYAGSLTVSIPKGSFSAMGFYGPLLLVDFASEADTITNLNLGKVPAKLAAKLKEKNVTPAGSHPIRRAAGGGWELHTADSQQFEITDDDGKFNVLRSDKTFFVYVTLNAASGTGVTVGPITFTAIVFGYGYNRRAKIPTIEKVAEFPLVKMVMGQGGYQEEDETFELHNQLAKPLEDPVSVLEKMKSHLVPELGQQFACAGVRFTIAGTVDCFALAVVQWGGGQLEISLLGLARFRQPRDTTAKAICYVELQILMTIKPTEGTFKLQALLTNNSWVINKDCRLTGGFALFAWFDGEHKGDLVVTLGGYHPRFRRPEHYPIVPRLGLNWPVNDNLSIKGGVYLAYTPSCGMLGAKLEATFHSGRISAWFTAYLDVIINWSPIFFEADLGISLRVEASFFLTSISVTISATIEMWGPPVGGIAHIDLTVVKFDIDFGTPRPAKPPLVKSWQEFCHNFLNLSGGDRPAVNEPVLAFPVMQPNLNAGRNNLNTLPNAQRKDATPKPEDGVWKVRADELELAAAATVPATTMNVGKVKTNSPPEGIQDRKSTGRSMMVTKAVTLDSTGLRSEKSKNKLGVHPMGQGFDSVLNVTVVRDEAGSVAAIDISDWAMKEERGSLPAAIWEPGEPNMRPVEPTAKLVEGCITGLKRLKPPRGTLGNKATPPPIEWHRLAPVIVAKATTTQEKPAASTARNVQSFVAQKQDEQKQIAAALATIGFSLGWKQVAAADVRFRELQADSFAGPVAA